MATIAAIEPVRPRRRRPRSSDSIWIYLARRVAWGALVVAVVGLTVFIVTRLASDPARVMIGSDGTEEQYRVLQDQLGLNDPILTQFITYLKDLATLNLGESFWQKVPVTELVFDRLPNTMVLVAAAMTIAVLFGVMLGVAAAIRPGTWTDHSLAFFALIGLSVPQFWLGAMLILVFAVQLGWFPTSGLGGIDHLMLPALALALPTLGRIAQVTRSTMIDEMAAHHIFVAKAKGMGMFHIVTRHALRNAMVPILTIACWETAYALAGYGVVVETVFAWPGIGYLALQAIQREDLVLVQGVVLVAAVIIVVINVLADLLYKVVDPRIEL